MFTLRNVAMLFIYELQAKVQKLFAFAICTGEFGARGQLIKYLRECVCIVLGWGCSNEGVERTLGWIGVQEGEKG